MTNFEAGSILRAPFNTGLAIGGTALGLMTRALEPMANHLMQSSDGQAEFVRGLREEGILEEIEAAADLVRNNQDSGVPSVLEYGYLHVGKGVLKADASELVPPRTVLHAAEVAVGIHLRPRRLALTTEGVYRLDHLMETTRTVFFLPSAK